MDPISLSLWIIAFACGNLVGMHTDAFVFTSHFVNIAVLCLVVCLPPLLNASLRRTLVFLVGLFWGASHSAPSPKQNLEHVQITHKNLIPFGSGMLVTSPHTNSYFFLTGKGKIGQQGQSLFYEKSSVYPPDRNYFKSNTPTLDISDKLYIPIFNLFENQLSGVPSSIKSFIYSILLGSTQDLSSEILEAFKILGIFHILVVSGLHVSLIASLIRVLVRSPFQFLYALCVINPRSWFWLSPLLQLVSCLFVFLFALSIGFPSSVQRSVLLFFVDELSKIGGVQISLHKRILGTVFLQTIFFAFDVFSLGSLLSWTSYITVYALAKQEKVTWMALLQCQCSLTFYIAAFLGQVSLIGCLLNLIIVPLFPFILFWIFPILLQGTLVPDIFVEMGTRVQRSFLEFLRELAFNVEGIPLAFFDISQWNLLRAISLLAALLLTFLLIRKIPCT